MLSTYENKLKKAIEKCHKLFSKLLPNSLTKFMPVHKLK